MDKIAEFEIVSSHAAKSIIPAAIDGNLYFKPAIPLDLMEIYIDEKDIPEVEGNIIMSLDDRDVGGVLPIKDLVKGKIKAKLPTPIFVDAGAKLIVNLVLSKDAPGHSQMQRVVLKFKEF
jgi:hypothetical protein